MNDKPPENDVTQSRPRSRSRCKSQPRPKSSSNNPYINFLRDFRNSNNANQKELFRTAGERWRAMTDAEKAPYFIAAKEAKSKRENQPKDKLEKKNEKEGAKLEQKNACKSKKIRPRKCCSECGHKHGNRLGVEKGPLPWRQRRALRDNAGSARDTDDTSRSRSGSKDDEGSKDESSTSGSSATFFLF